MVSDQEVSRVSVERISVLFCWCFGSRGRIIGEVGEIAL